MHFPYGIADFYKIQEEGYIYADRTDRIALLEETGSQLFSCARTGSVKACGCPPWKTTTIWRGLILSGQGDTSTALDLAAA